jgi:acetyl-CoA decarbonylase/synthase complex subunit delta
MAFEITRESYAGKVTEVTLGATAEQGGTRSAFITIGGSDTLPFHFFEGKFPHRPVIAMEVFDKKPPKYPEPLLEYFRDVIDRPGDMAVKCVNEYGAEMISVRLEGTHPERKRLKSSKKYCPALASP